MSMEDLFDETTDPNAGKIVDRERPQPPTARARHVQRWTSMLRDTKSYFSAQFKRMKQDQDFTRGVQWDDQTRKKEKPDPRYVANVTLRHVQQRVAGLYAKNPTAVAKRRERIDYTVWDGTISSLMEAQQTMQMAQQAMDVGVGVPAGLGEQVANAQAIIQDWQRVEQQRKLLDRMAKTLELLFEYELHEQAHPFKMMMKLMVRRAVTTGVGYVRLGFQRTTGMDPSFNARIQDAEQKLATIERLAAEYADGEINKEDPEADQLRLTIASLQQEAEVVLREGLTFDYPASTAILVDKKCVSLRDFVGADWVAQEYCMSTEEIFEVFGKDVKSSYKSYGKPNTSYDAGDKANTQDHYKAGGDQGQGESPAGTGWALVWEIYCRKDGLVYFVCDGYPEFLKEPAAPDVWTERFYPWYALVLNECDDEEDIYPPSDVALMWHQQKEINRGRQGLREHRTANRPKTITATGALNDTDRDKLQNHPANAVIELSALQPGQSVDQVLQAYKGPPIDPALYNVTPAYEDILRTVGVQEANLGGTSGATATESSIAEASRMSTQSSNVDDLDDLLTQLVLGASQIMIIEFSAETVKQAVGVGAAWPEVSKKEAAQNLWLEVEAGSTGRPNKAQEIQNAQTIIPLLQQMPGVNPEFLVRELIRRLDERLDMTSGVYIPGLPSIVSMNQNRQPQTGNAATEPTQQGGEGAIRTREPVPGQGTAQPAPTPYETISNGPGSLPVQ